MKIVCIWPVGTEHLEKTLFRCSLRPEPTLLPEQAKALMFLALRCKRTTIWHKRFFGIFLLGASSRKIREASRIRLGTWPCVSSLVRLLRGFQTSKELRMRTFSGRRCETERSSALMNQRTISLKCCINAMTQCCGFWLRESLVFSNIRRQETPCCICCAELTV